MRWACAIWPISTWAGQICRKTGKLRGMTQVALAEKAGVNRVTVAEIETGRNQGLVTTLRALSEALGVSLDDLAEQGRPTTAGRASTMPRGVILRSSYSTPPAAFRACKSMRCGGSGQSHGLGHTWLRSISDFPIFLHGWRHASRPDQWRLDVRACVTRLSEPQRAA